MEKRHKITTKEQFQILISELEKKSHLVRGNHSGSSFRQDWEEIKIKLNAHGPPIRDCDGWQRVWRDFKFKLRKKLLQKEAGNNSPVFLSPFEEAAEKLICPGNKFSNKSSHSDPPVEEIKPDTIDATNWKEEKRLQSENESTEEDKLEEETMLDDEYLPSTSASSSQANMLTSPERRKRKRKYKSDKRKVLLSKHNDMQKNILNEILKTLKELKNLLALSSQYQRKMLEFEERKLQLMQLKDDRENELHKSEMKLNFLEMKIRSKEVEVLEERNH